MSDERTVTTGSSHSVTDADVERAMKLYYGAMSPVEKYMGDGPSDGEAADYRAGFRAVLEDYAAGRASGDATRGGTENLTAALRWALDYIADGAAEDQTPVHKCELVNNPERGECAFHAAYWSARDALENCVPAATRDRDLGDWVNAPWTVEDIREWNSARQRQLKRWMDNQPGTNAMQMALEACHEIDWLLTHGSLPAPQKREANDE